MKKLQKLNDDDRSLGDRIAQMRKERGLTLSEMSKLVGLPVSTLSKVQNHQATLSYSNLMRLARGLKINIAELFDDDVAMQKPKAGRRVITRKGMGMMNKVDCYDVEVLASDLLHKNMHPGILTVPPAGPQDIDALAGHPGEEFVYVISGSILLYSEDYKPLELFEGDSIYLDSTSGHKYVSASDKPARILVTCSAGDSETS